MPDRQLAREDGAPSRKPYRAILDEEIAAGLVEIRRPVSGLFLSSISAGLDIGFSLLLMGVVLTHLAGDLGPALTRILVANMYAVGFLLVILGRSELFTEHTALAVIPVLARRASLLDLARVWTVVFGGNMIGALVFAALTSAFAPPLGAVDPAALATIANDLLDHPWWLVVVSAVLAGWLMGELGWMLAAARDTISQIVFVWLVTAAIGFVGLHHVVVGAVEVTAGMLVSESIGGADLLRFLGLAGLGNTIGGLVFVALIKYGHAVRAVSEEEAVDGSPPAE